MPNLSTLINKTLQKLFENWYLQDDIHSVINPNRPTINVNPISYFYESQYYGNLNAYVHRWCISLPVVDVILQISV